jgi:23S rRNA pseudouridine955/2504/2580 synthase
LKEITIGKNDSGMRLDRFIYKAVPLLPTSLCQKYIRLKRIKVNEKPSDSRYRLREGDVLSLYINDEFFEAPSEENAYLKIPNPRLDIIYEDDNILLVDKKPGILVHPDKGEFQNTLIANIQAYLYLKGQWQPRKENSFVPSLCNRLDRNTGVIFIAAKNATALRIINDRIRNHEIDKYYLCIVHGVPSPPSGTLKGYIIKENDKNRVFVLSRPEKGAKSAVTEYRTITSKNNLSLLECRLLTGRTHQIRAQLSAAGHPLLGDIKYGAEKDAETFQALYSYKLVFNFKTPAGELEYLKNKAFCVPRVEFIEKYFSLKFLH